jgi:hypothetical protein
MRRVSGADAKLASQARARAEQCGGLAQGTQCKSPLCEAGGGVCLLRMRSERDQLEPERSEGSSRARSKATRSVPDWPSCRTGHCAGLATWDSGHRLNLIRGAPATRRRHSIFSVPDCALKSSANLNGWIALKTFEYLRLPTRARSSERAASVTLVNQISGPTEESATKVSVRHRARA